MSGHTPGPWAVSDDGEVYSVPRHQSVCMVLLQSDDGANARLIAAAPETAAELERAREVIAELVGAMHVLVNTAPLTRFEYTEFSDAVDQAQAVLAKHARAETSHGD